jgi:hypothetical protein
MLLGDILCPVPPRMGREAVREVHRLELNLACAVLLLWNCSLDLILLCNIAAATEACVV